MTHEELVERVATTLAVASLASGDIKAWSHAAIAAMAEALKEPTPEMANAAWKAIGLKITERKEATAHLNALIGGPHEAGVIRAYRAMLSASPLYPKE